MGLEGFGSKTKSKIWIKALGPPPPPPSLMCWHLLAHTFWVQVWIAVPTTYKTSPRTSKTGRIWQRYDQNSRKYCLACISVISGPFQLFLGSKICRIASKGSWGKGMGWKKNPGLPMPITIYDWNYCIISINWPSWVTGLVVLAEICLLSQFTWNLANLKKNGQKSSKRHFFWLYSTTVPFHSICYITCNSRGPIYEK